MGNRALKKRIASLRRLIAEHQAKIAIELARARPDSGLIRHWQTEIEAFQTGVDRALKRLG